ncbi:MAG: hypothetical protein C4K58_00715 [Flavobacteriaceae bacterium]|nr:MAG: hypothetical protein C4K58_00715 [Flavobacteriaceae bacterium]
MIIEKTTANYTIMKKTIKKIASLAIIGVLMASCTTTQKPAEGAVSASSQQRSVDGEWTLSSIQHNASGKVEIQYLDEGRKECLVGSKWVLIRNYTGTYTINPGAGCNPGDQSIMWSIEELDGQNYFMFKKLTDQKAKDILSGYRLHLDYVDETSMQLSQEIPFEGSKITIKYKSILRKPRGFCEQNQNQRFWRICSCL